MRKSLFTMALLAVGSLLSSANADQLTSAVIGTESLLLRCCSANAVDAETGEVIKSVEVCGGDSDAEYIITCNQANALLHLLMEAPE